MRKPIANTIKNFLIFGALIFLIFQLYGLWKLNKDLETNLTKKESEISLVRNEIGELLFKEIVKYQINNTRIENAFLYDVDGDSIQLFEFFKHSRIVLHYSELSCLDCVNEEVKHLKEISDSIEKDRVLIIASYDNRRDLFLFKRINGLVDFNVYRIKENATGLITDSLNIPTIMVIDSALIIRETFFPNALYPEKSEQYYHSVIKKYFP